MGELSRVLKVSFAYVSAIAHPEYYRGDQPCVPASQVPDEHWSTAERTGDGIWDQYNGLRGLLAAGELIRDVRVYEAEAVEPQWQDVTPRPEVA